MSSLPIVVMHCLAGLSAVAKTLVIYALVLLYE